MAQTTVRATRPACPFYGFVRLATVLMDNRGNACGVAGGHRPCAMEMNSRTPDWRQCPWNNAGNQTNIELALDFCTIFPDEMRPPNVPEWEGLRLREWYELFKQR